MKIEFQEHIPDFCDPRGVKAEHSWFNSLEELLKSKRKWLRDKQHKDLVFAYGDYDMLMVSSKSEKWWWVIGYVDGIDLSEHLPYFEDVYKGE